MKTSIRGELGSTAAVALGLQGGVLADRLSFRPATRLANLVQVVGPRLNPTTMFPPCLPPPAHLQAWWRWAWRRRWRRAACRRRC